MRAHPAEMSGWNLLLILATASATMGCFHWLANRELPNEVPRILLDLAAAGMAGGLVVLLAILSFQQGCSDARGHRRTE